MTGLGWRLYPLTFFEQYGYVQQFPTMFAGVSRVSVNSSHGKLITYTNRIVGYGYGQFRFLLHGCDVTS